MRVPLTTSMNTCPASIWRRCPCRIPVARTVAKLTPVEVRSFHDQTLDEGQLHVRGIKMDTTHFAGCPQSFVSPLKALSTCLAFVGQGIGDLEAPCRDHPLPHLVRALQRHSRQDFYNIPLVITVHSLNRCAPGSATSSATGLLRPVALD